MARLMTMMRVESLRDCRIIRRSVDVKRRESIGNRWRKRWALFTTMGRLGVY